MKRFGNLYERIYDIDNLKLAHKNARKGKRAYSEVCLVDAKQDHYLEKLHLILKNGEFKNSRYKIFTISDRGKQREIYKLPYFPDRIVHHAIMQILEPIWKSVLIRDTYQSIKGRGVHDGKKRIETVIRNDKPRYCLKFDVKKFYPSVNHDVLKTIIRQKIKCNRTLRLLDEIIDSAPGLPIGNYLSQYFGNLYLTYFDHWIKEYKGIKFYFRYCDDIIVFNNDKDFLHCLLQEIKEYFKIKLLLEIKSNYQVFPVSARGVDFLGFRFYYRYTLLRKTIVRNFKRKISIVINKWPILSKFYVVNGLMSYYGWIKCCNAYNLWKSRYTNSCNDILTYFKGTLVWK